MKFATAIQISEIANRINAELVGENSLAHGLNEIHKVENGDITFVDHPKYYKKALQSKASFVIIDKAVEERYGKTILVCEGPFKAYNSLVQEYKPKYETSDQLIHPNASIGKNSKLFPGVFVGDGAMIGDNCIIYANVSIYPGVQIMDNVIIHSNTTIGADAFYYKKWSDENLTYDKMHTCGSVKIESHVEIGPACTIDKGVSGETRIGEGTKLDAQVHIGHGAVLGKNCLVAAQSGIAGKTIIGDKVTIWGQVGISSKLKIEDEVTILAQSGVGRDCEKGKTYFGSPAGEAKEKMKELVYIKRLGK